MTGMLNSLYRLRDKKKVLAKYLLDIANWNSIGLKFEIIKE